MNKLKRLYEIDKLLYQLKAEKKEIMEVIDLQEIKQQGKYILIREPFQTRTINVDKYKELVPEDVFNKSIIVPVQTAEKYLPYDTLEKICTRKTNYKIFVVKS